MGAVVEFVMNGVDVVVVDIKVEMLVSVTLEFKFCQ